MPRTQVESGLDPQRLRPQASPVDTFAPDRRVADSLAGLAQGLASLEPALARFASGVSERSKEENTARGEAKARELDEQRVTFRDAVKKGLLDPHENPWFVYGAKVQMGRAEAGKYGSDLMETMLTDRELQESGNLADFDAKEASFRKQWMEQHVGEQRDNHFDKGFGPIAEGYVLDARRSFAASAGARLEKTAGENHGVIVGQALEEASHTGDFKTALQIINAETADYLRDNPRAGRIANLRTIQAVGDWARLHYKDVTQESLTSLLQGIDAGPGGKLFGTHEAKEMIAKATQEATQLRQQDNSLADYQESKDKREGTKALFSDLSETFLKAADPSKVNLDAALKRAKSVDPVNGVKAVYEFQEMFVNRRDIGDSQVFESALLRVHGDDPNRPGVRLSMKDVSGLRNSLSYQQVSSLLSEIGQREQRAAQGQADPIDKLFSKDIVANARKALTHDMGYDDFGMKNDPEIITRAGAAAQAFNAALIQNWESFSKMEPKALQSEMAELSERTFKQYATDEMLALHRDVESTVVKTKQAAEKGEFKDAIHKITSGDDIAVDALRNAVTRLQTPKGRAEFKGFDDATKRLLFRLGVPPQIDKINQFFTELDRTSRE